MVSWRSVAAFGFVIAAACHTAEAPPPASPAPVVEVVTVSRDAATTVTPIADAVLVVPDAAEVLATARGAPAAVTPRMRAAFGMLLYLRKYAATLVQMDAKAHQFTKNGCPTGIAWVTFGTAKTDPWGTGFQMRCTPGADARTEIGSAGPDRAVGTADDLWSDRPIVDAVASCDTACARVTACGKSPSVDKLRAGVCGASCRAPDTQVPFLASTCALVESCDAAVACMKTAIANEIPDVECAHFGRAAARALGRPTLVAALTRECEQDILRAHELVCVQASTTASELALCFLTVNRARVAELAN